MPSKTEEYLALAQRTANGLTRYWESWTDYLTTASRLYKYSFADQLMIYAQRPDATACADFDIWNNRILTKTEHLMMSNRPPDPKNARNKNVLVVGGSGSGKTRFWLKPNLLQCHSSYVVTDPKGSIVVECGNALLQKGYKRDKAEKDLLALKTEILAVIKGESAFPKDTLAEMIAAQEKKHTELDTLCEEASAELERNAELMANVSQLYEELISYADLYDSASFEAKKMIVSQLIRRVEVYRGYQIHVDFNFDLAQYLENSDELAC